MRAIFSRLLPICRTFLRDVWLAHRKNESNRRETNDGTSGNNNNNNGSNNNSDNEDDSDNDSIRNTIKVTIKVTVWENQISRWRNREMSSGCGEETAADRCCECSGLSSLFVSLGDICQKGERAIGFGCGCLVWMANMFPGAIRCSVHASTKETMSLDIGPFFYRPFKGCQLSARRQWPTHPREGNKVAVGVGSAAESCSRSRGSGTDSPRARPRPHGDMHGRGLLCLSPMRPVRRVICYA